MDCRCVSHPGRGARDVEVKNLQHYLADVWSVTRH